MNKEKGAGLQDNSDKPPRKVEEEVAPSGETAMLPTLESDQISSGPMKPPQSSAYPTYLSDAMFASGSVSPSGVLPSYVTTAPTDNQWKSQWHNPFPADHQWKWWHDPFAADNQWKSQWHNPFPGQFGEGAVHLMQRDAKLRELEGNLTESKRRYAELQDEFRKKIEEAKSKGQAYEQATKENQTLLAQLDAQRVQMLKEKSRKDIGQNVETAALAFADTDDRFYKLFKSRLVTAFILSIDLRKSTTLMLKARDPELFAMFIESLCDGLHATVLANHGVFDKFTGDGILAFFPNFYSGEDAGYWAVQTASQCHEVFRECYKKHRNCFASVLSEVGLGIGIDFGSVRLVSSWGGLTVVGAPVVYACRMGGAPPGKTFLNQPAYEQVLEKYSAFCSLREDVIDVKGEGKTFAYSVELGAKRYDAAAPDWAKLIEEHVERDAP